MKVPQRGTCPQCDRVDAPLTGDRSQCLACYQKAYRARQPLIVCADCGKTKRRHVGDVCQSCYGRRWQPKKPADVVFLDEPCAGNAEAGDPRLPARFWSKVRVASNGCWHWTGAVDSDGYSKFRVHPGFYGKMRAHRVARLALSGPVPDDLCLDHTCHNLDLSCPGGNTCSHRRCVNPSHLEPVTSAENLQRGRPRGRKPLPPSTSPEDTPRCGQGHPQWGSNLYVSPKGKRKCRPCERRTAFERYQRQGRRTSRQLARS